MGGNVNDVGNLTLYPQANSRYMGANIPESRAYLHAVYRGVGASPNATTCRRAKGYGGLRPGGMTITCAAALTAILALGLPRRAAHCGVRSAGEGPGHQGRGGPAWLNQPVREAFRQGLGAATAGGRSERRHRVSVSGRDGALPELVAELVRLKVSVILVAGETMIIAARQATATIPIVMAAVGDPVGRGFVASLARPGGNITGVSNMAVEMTGKWVELLKEAVPKATKVAALRNPANPTHDVSAPDAGGSSGARRANAVCGGKDRRGVDHRVRRHGKEQAGALIVFPTRSSTAAPGGVAALAEHTGCRR
jgi:hypothetical protein